MSKTKQLKININEGNSLWKISFKKFIRNKLAIIGLIILLLLVISSVLAPFLTGYDRDAVSLTQSYQAPSKEHLLGTDDLGRDVFTRLIYGGRVSLSVGLASTSISIVIGVLLGAVAGYFGKVTDVVIMRVVDLFMSMPFYVMTITVAALFGPSIWNVMIMTGLLTWTNIARIVRAEVMSLKEREFVEASKALGLSPAEVLFKHVIPNTFAIIIVYATLGIANGILSEAGLSYLGLGVKQPQPSWGNMLASAQSLRSLKLHWWLWVPPGLLVFVTVLSINLLGDGLRDALDPKLRQN